MRLRLKLATVGLAAALLASAALALPAFAEGGASGGQAKTKERAPLAAPESLNAQARKYSALLEIASAQTGKSTADLVSQLRGKALARVLGREASAALLQQVLTGKRAELESQGLRPARIERELKKLETETKRLLAQRVPSAVLRQLTRWASDGPTRPADPTPTPPPAITPGTGPIYGGLRVGDFNPAIDSDNPARPAAAPDATRRNAGAGPIYGTVAAR